MHTHFTYGIKFSHTFVLSWSPVVVLLHGLQITLQTEALVASIMSEAAIDR